MHDAEREPSRTLWALLGNDVSVEVHQCDEQTALVGDVEMLVMGDAMRVGNLCTFTPTFL